MRLTKSNSLIKVVFLGLVSLVLGGCEGFMDGGLQKKELDEALQYNKSAYAKVEISANASAVKTLVPAANLYDSSYKKNDKIELKFEPKPSYQFLYWTAEPAGSVVFDSITDLNTNAKIVSNTNSTIVITPKTVVRPIVTVSPDSTGGAKPKNTSIYINFNHPIDLTEEELAKLWILRKVFAPMEDTEILELILDRMKKSKTNDAFLASMNVGTAGMDS